MNKSFEKITGNFSDDELADEILEFARRYRAEDFPNPERENCPDAGVLQKIVTARQLPEPRLAEHLIVCSECIADLGRLRASRTTTVSDNGNRRFWWFLLPATAVFAMLFITIFWLRSEPPPVARSGSNVPEDRPSSEPPAASPVETVEEPARTPPQKQTAVRSKDQSIPKEKEVSRRVYNFDLSAAQITRGISENPVPAMLPASRVKINLRLIDNSPRGRYRLSILNSEADPAIDPQLIDSDGKTIAAELDLRKIRGRLRLCAAPDGEIPDCIPIIIQNSK